MCWTKGTQFHEKILNMNMRIFDFIIFFFFIYLQGANYVDANIQLCNHSINYEICYFVRERIILLKLVLIVTIITPYFVGPNGFYIFIIIVIIELTM